MVVEMNKLLIHNKWSGTELKLNSRLTGSSIPATNHKAWGRDRCLLAWCRLKGPCCLSCFTSCNLRLRWASSPSSVHTVWANSVNRSCNWGIAWGFGGWKFAPGDCSLSCFAFCLGRASSLALYWGGGRVVCSCRLGCRLCPTFSGRHGVASPIL